ncbi:hypothetical protein BDF21DRAFT_457790 [Thamnidium elegans]|uniref:Uncharacterized protein n=1 Tax=Thamnidium elegans TaxID=101142 RepID=A0A8H7SRA4_9FUNG|nr:hypothetical protein INT48_005759 [Thamnidium elegans]KAI8095499.1 hypothetical protein BDF21DRAFT_457790 [Thamnidium elegans]
MVFPKVDYWIDRFNNKDHVQEDRAGPKSLKLLKYLRIVFLQKVQMAIPEMTAAIQSGFEMLSNQMKSIQQANLNEVRDIRQSLSHFFALGSAHFNFNPQRPSSDVSNSSLALINPSSSSSFSPSASNQ